MKGLSPKQKQVLDILEGAVSRGEHLTVREIGDRIGVSSTCTVHQHLKALERKGYIKPTNHKHRSIQLTTPPQLFVSLPFCGAAVAGEPTGAQAAEPMEPLLLPSQLVGTDACQLYRVRGNSMTGAAICDGDAIIVHPQSECADGDVVVAKVKDEAVVKRLAHENGIICLCSEQAGAAPIYPEDESAIVGRVGLVIRRL
ncbi:MAG TPA: transcriptional repressor LexA [Armatimonadota bacterium]|nr:transcriptional repressor LexA [Armatimonadota bacterium]